MRPERIRELQKLLAQSYPEYFILRTSIWGGDLFTYREGFSDEAYFIGIAVNKFEHRIAL
jgi:hypothetical protein